MSIRVLCFLAFSVLLVKAFPAKDSLEDLIAVESNPLEVKALGEEPIDTTDVPNSDEENVTESTEEDVSDSSNENETSASDESSTEENSESKEHSKDDDSENEPETSSEDNMTESEESNDTEESENSDESYKPDYSEESDSEYEDSEDNNDEKDLPILPVFYNMNFFTVENGVVTICTQLVNINTRKVVSEKCHVSGLSPPSYMAAPVYVGIPHSILSNGFTL